MEKNMKQKIISVEQLIELTGTMNQLYGLLKDMKYMVEWHKKQEKQYEEKNDYRNAFYHHGSWFTLNEYVKDLENTLYKEI